MSPLQSLEYDSVPKSSAVQIGLSCNGCSASSDTTPPSFDAANSFPAHNSVASRFTNVVLAFSEVPEEKQGPVTIQLSTCDPPANLSKNI